MAVYLLGLSGVEPITQNSDVFQGGGKNGVTLISVNVADPSCRRLQEIDTRRPDSSSSAKKTPVMTDRFCGSG